MITKTSTTIYKLRDLEIGYCVVIDDYRVICWHERDESEYPQSEVSIKIWSNKNEAYCYAQMFKNSTVMACTCETM